MYLPISLKSVSFVAATMYISAIHNQFLAKHAPGILFMGALVAAVKGALPVAAERPLDASPKVALDAAAEGALDAAAEGALAEAPEVALLPVARVVGAKAAAEDGGGGGVGGWPDPLLAWFLKWRPKPWSSV